MAEGSFKDLMVAIDALYATVHADLSYSRWRPLELPELPALWNAPPSEDSPLEQLDQAAFRDTIELSAYIGADPAPVEDEMDTLEDYADAFRAVVDPALHRNGPLDGTATMAQRRGMRLVIDSFNQVDVLCIEFPLSIRIQRLINPGP